MIGRRQPDKAAAEAEEEDGTLKFPAAKKLASAPNADLFGKGFFLLTK